MLTHYKGCKKDAKGNNDSIVQLAFTQLQNILVFNLVSCVFHTVNTRSAFEDFVLPFSTPLQAFLTILVDVHNKALLDNVNLLMYE